MNDDSRLPPLIPREILFGNPERAMPQIAPDGRTLAYLAPRDGVLNVWVRPVERDEPRPITHDTDRGVRVYFWAHDGDHILYLQDVGGDENWRLYSVHVERAEVTDLTPFEKVQVQILTHDRRHPHELLLAINKEDERHHDVYHLDLRTRELRMVAKNPGNVVSWVADRDLNVRVATVATADGGLDLLTRDPDDAAWRTLVQWTPEDALTSGPIGTTLDGRALYAIDSRAWNAGRLVRIDLGSGDVDVLAEDPRYDVGHVMLHPDTREVQLVEFYKARAEYRVLDESIDRTIDVIRKLNRGDFQVSSRDHADDIWIVTFTEDDRPVSHYAVDRRRDEGWFLLTTRPRLAQFSLATMEPISFEARDGLEVHGYLSIPPGAEPRNLPLVLNVHGGPWHRDVWGYDPESQWLANRGYACLQVNFRGSTGYGKDFLNAGDREWGGRMHDDLVDAVRWAVERGVADANRVGIYGGSYGGYASLVGATMTPELFACAVDIVGPSNLITFIETIPPYWSSYLAMLQQRVGNPETDADFLRDRSPLTHVQNVRVPLLIAQGANDPRVKQSESEQIVAAMEERGIDHEYLLYPDEGHGFAKPENRLHFYARAEQFLAKHLGGRFEPCD